MARFYVWAHAIDAPDVVKLVRRLERDTGREVGAVLNFANYEASSEMPSILRVSNPNQARRAANYNSPVILGDEPNISGLSGRYKTPEEYAELFQRMSDLIPSSVPRYAAGIAFINPNGWIDDVLQKRVFDYKYAAQLPVADGYALNPGHCTRWETMRALNYMNDLSRVGQTQRLKTLISPHPYNLTWEVLGAWSMERVRKLTIPFYRGLVDADRAHVAIWSLRQHYTSSGKFQNYHSLFTLDNRLTRLGREFVRVANQD